ncbi:hypothetical protein J2S34_000081 [Nitrobacter winogradskyi]|uniref:Uncharacterized protein n=1 Tax=Nitrobacter winogradskyi TaxID=913 RepID=A0ACC6AD65_NITWI|nr:hypothetical protein [Nitrobacter winogradskyi]
MRRLPLRTCNCDDRRDTEHGRAAPPEQHGQNDVIRCDAKSSFDTIILAASTGTSFGELVAYNVS